MATATRSPICGETHAVTAGAGAWDTGTCWLTVGHDGECDFQVNEPPRTIIQPWHPGDPLPVRVEACAACVYDIRAHKNGRCPTSEAEAVEMWGRS